MCWQADRLSLVQNPYFDFSCYLSRGIFSTLLFCFLINQEFDNADGEECSGGSSPIQEDSLSSCPSLPEVYTLPVRDRPNCPALQDGAGNNPPPLAPPTTPTSHPVPSPLRSTSSSSGSVAWVADVDLIKDSNWVFNHILNFNGVETMIRENCAWVLGAGQIGFFLLCLLLLHLDVWASLCVMMLCICVCERENVCVHAYVQVCYCVTSTKYQCEWYMGKQHICVLNDWSHLQNKFGAFFFLINSDCSQRECSLKKRWCNRWCNTLINRLLFWFLMGCRYQFHYLIFILKK